MAAMAWRSFSQIGRSDLRTTKTLNYAPKESYILCMVHDPKARPQILVVEDDPDAREALIDVLEISGYSAEPAGNGREAIDLLRQSSLPSLIILDLQMPVMNGWEFRAA